MPAVAPHDRRSLSGGGWRRRAVISKPRSYELRLASQRSSQRQERRIPPLATQLRIEPKRCGGVAERQPAQVLRV